jgi:hypothetical protein
MKFLKGSGKPSNIEDQGNALRQIEDGANSSNILTAGKGRTVPEGSCCVGSIPKPVPRHPPGTERRQAIAEGVLPCSHCHRARHHRPAEEAAFSGTGFGGIPEPLRCHECHERLRDMSDIPTSVVTRHVCQDSADEHSEHSRAGFQSRFPPIRVPPRSGDAAPSRPKERISKETRGALPTARHQETRLCSREAKRKGRGHKPTPESPSTHSGRTGEMVTPPLLESPNL